MKKLSLVKFRKAPKGFTSVCYIIERKEPKEKDKYKTNWKVSLNSKLNSESKCSTLLLNYELCGTEVVKIVFMLSLKVSE